jgi:hemerythrin-like domain-containing protein
MSFSNRVCAMLHDDHRASIAHMERLEQFLRANRRGHPDCSQSDVKRLLSDLIVGVKGEIERHFDFEERCLFPYLATAGDEAIGEHLTDEHAAIRPLGRRIVELAQTGLGSGFNDRDFEEFRRLGQELYERTLTHVQKEEMALLPFLEEAMDAETEAKLYEYYAQNG